MTSPPDKPSHGRSYYLKKLREPLARADDESFLEGIWSICALQSDQPLAALQHFRFPANAVTQDISSKFAVHAWELETLALLLLTVPKESLRKGKNRITNSSDFSAMSNIINRLRKLENVESGIYLRRLNVFYELHRTAQRQFHWQRGYLSQAQFYRYAYIFGQGACASYFESKYGLTVSDFSLLGFSFHAAFRNHAALQRPISMNKLGVTREAIGSALTLLTKPISDARSEAADLIKSAERSMRGWLPTAYLPSLLRRFPIISFGADGGRLRCPIPELILLRVTAGLYYDFVAGGQHLLNDASDRFEDYCSEYMRALFTGFSVHRSFRYKVNKNPVDSPDILIKDRGVTVVVAECKAAKLTLGAQFANKPEEEANAGYREIAKGVFQLWRYFSHVRRGILTGDPVRPDAPGMLIMLDSWLTMSERLQQHVYAMAEELADKDGNITANDRRRIVFCPVQELETTLLWLNEDTFLRLLKIASDEEFSGWMLPSILNRTNLSSDCRRRYPFELGKVLPWWERTENLRRQRH